MKGLDARLRLVGRPMNPRMTAEWLNAPHSVSTPPAVLKTFGFPPSQTVEADQQHPHQRFRSLSELSLGGGISIKRQPF